MDGGKLAVGELSMPSNQKAMPRRSSPRKCQVFRTVGGSTMRSRGSLLKRTGELGLARARIGNIGKARRKPGHRPSPLEKVDTQIHSIPERYLEFSNPIALMLIAGMFRMSGRHRRERLESRRGVQCFLKLGGLGSRHPARHQPRGMRMP